MIYDYHAVVYDGQSKMILQRNSNYRCIKLDAHHLVRLCLRLMAGLINGALKSLIQIKNSRL